MNSSCSFCSSGIKIWEFLIIFHLFNIKCVEGLKPQKPQEHILSRVKKQFPFLYIQHSNSSQSFLHLITITCKSSSRKNRSNFNLYWKNGYLFYLTGWQELRRAIYKTNLRKGLFILVQPQYKFPDEAGVLECLTRSLWTLLPRLKLSWITVVLISGSS